MIVNEVTGFDVKYFKINREEGSPSFNETDCFEYYRSVGFNVYFGYGSIIRRHNKIKDILNPKTRYQRMIMSLPVFSDEIEDLFKKYKSGEPDLLMERNGIWEFVEVKTTNDSLRANQLMFIEELSCLTKVSVHQFIEIKQETTKNMLGTPRKIREHKKLAKETGCIKSINKNETLKSLFEKELFLINKNQLRKNFKKYWTVAKIYSLFPEFSLTQQGLELIEKYTGLSGKTITWYVEKNKRKIIEDALLSLSRKDSVSDREVKLIKEYKKLLIR
jgi:hypothetical protein